MTETELATIQGPSQQIREIIEKTALAGRGDPFHSDVYVSVTEGRVDTIVGSEGHVVLSYCTFGENSDLDDVSVTEGDSAQAIINVADFMSYLDFASDGGDIKLAFRGNPDDPLASVLEVTGALNTRVMLPASETILEQVPTVLEDRFNDENEFLSGEDGSTPGTVIDTDVEQIQRLIEVVDYDPETKFYPVTVEETEDGFDFALDIGKDSQRNAVWGELNGSVTSEDEVHNQYQQGFEPVFNVLNGNVRLQTDAGGAPLVVVQDTRDGVELRHVIGNVSD